MAPLADNPTRILVRPDSSIAVERSRFRLRIDKGAHKGRELVSAQDRVVVGNHPGADLVLDDPAVSRSHFEIIADPRGHLLRDLDSTNGTRVQGVRVIEAFLPVRARVGAGSTELSFTVLDESESVPLHPVGSFGALLGQSPAMRALFDRLACVADRNVAVLIEGESGTGKELAARALHEASLRKKEPFVVLDCGAIARTLLEAELFGHQKGAYTGAQHARAGAFQRAHGGTLFLDEIGELDLELQPRLLGAIERREVKPIGASDPVAVDVRIIAATNRELAREVNRGTFREDLYYRLAAVRVTMPPLREHLEDIPLLCRQFLEAQGQRDQTHYELDEATLRRLGTRAWPGNVRELRNVLEQIVAFGIDEVELPAAQVAKSDDGSPAGDRKAPWEGLSFHDAKAAVVDKFERDCLHGVLAEHKGNITASARALALDRVHFLRLLDKHGLRKLRS
jgi:DNA-binding NtrC family response regulator